MKNYFVITMVILLASCTTTTKNSAGYERPYLTLDITQNEAGEYVYCDSCPKPTLKVFDVEVGNAPTISPQTTTTVSRVSHALKAIDNAVNSTNQFQLPESSHNAPASVAAVQAEPQQSGKDADQIKIVFFEMDSSTLSEKDKFILSKLRFDENLTIEIKGYTDAYGSDAYNLKLSEHRALSVYQILKINNPNIKFHLLSKGKCCYLTSSPFDPVNRRVEVVIQKKVVRSKK